MTVSIDRAAPSEGRGRARRAVTPEPTAPPRVARVFDGCSDGKPWFAAARPLVVDERERAELLALLATGTPLLRSAALRDAVTGEESAVPAGLRSDGVWIWSDASAYYVDQHWIAPDPELVAHLRVSGEPTPVDAPTRRRLYAALRPDNWESTTWPLA
ncbi:hypothetical protein [Mycetocola reblochoni]|uniref:Uncharacterized protein n=2 Tax=Mycetocola reblochoni TaxID=331618 RepID=A0A1R4I822_9MICO|nr:hypothetical protein [Mycetocola reblochoni]RLP68932.1 hypothetical protein D9V30_08635 [Mycetocola reblochoni]SJN15899.1 hypothetical protein FM119_00275 [Mycetocola reblochoni REB411]